MAGNLLLVIPGATGSFPPMENLHAPWRIEYILAPKHASAGESRCTRIAQSYDYEAHYVISRTRTCFAVLNTNPDTGGHLMVFAYKETAELSELTEVELCDWMSLTQLSQRALTQLM